jgi:hypothetical protein
MSRLWQPVLSGAVVLALAPSSQGADDGDDLVYGGYGGPAIAPATPEPIESPTPVEPAETVAEPAAPPAEPIAQPAEPVPPPDASPPPEEPPSVFVAVPQRPPRVTYQPIVISSFDAEDVVNYHPVVDREVVTSSFDADALVNYHPTGD